MISDVNGVHLGFFSFGVEGGDRSEFRECGGEESEVFRRGVVLVFWLFLGKRGEELRGGFVEFRGFWKFVD